MADGPFALALDIGGTKLAAAAVRGDGTLAARHEVPNPQGDAESVWAAVTDVLDAVVAPTGLDRCVGVGVGTAGPIERATRTVSPVNIAGWRGFPLGARLADRFAGIDVRIAGDCVCMAVGEHWLGAARGCDDFVGVVVSTGVGGALVLGGRPHVGPSGNAGHLGHMTVDVHGERCVCGGTGCVEAIASGPSLLRWAIARGYAGNATVPAAAAAARAGDAAAGAAFDRAGTAVGVALATLATVCDVRLAVVGGGVAQAGEVLLAPIRAAVRRFATLDYTAGFEVRGAALGGDAGLVGAAALVLDPARYGTAVV